jgi:microcin C transport system substrate-binding protein
LTYRIAIPRLAMPTARFFRLFLLASAALGLLGCGPSGNSDAERFPAYDNSDEVDAHYKTHPEFFQFKEEKDLPADLVWDTGAGLEEIGSPKAKKGGDFRFYIDQYPATYRVEGPESNGSFRSEHWDNIYVTNVMVHPNLQGKYIPGVCNAWAVGADKKTVFYKIDPDASFTVQNHRTFAWSKVPVRTQDFFFLFYLETHDYLQDPWAKNHYTTKYASITRYSDLIFSITLAEQKADPVYWTALVPFCREYYKDFGPDFPERFNWRTNPTTGAYAIDLEHSIKNRKVVMKRIPDWWAKDKVNYRYRFNPDRIIYTVIGNMDKAFEVFRKGELDYFWLNAPNYWYEKMDIAPYNSGHMVKAKFYNRWPRPPYGVYINCSKPILSDREVRIGLHHAINVQKMIDVNMRGDYPRLNTTSDGYGVYTEPTLRARPYDPEQARKHFAAAGFSTLGEDGILQKASGERLSIELLVRSTPPTHRQYALRLKEEAKRAGVEIRIEVLDNTSMFKKLLEKKHDLAISAWNSTPPYPRYWEGYHSVNAYEMNEAKTDFKKNADGSRIPKTNTNNISMTADPELDKVIDEYEKATTTEDLVRLSHECSKRIYEEGSFIPGWNMNFVRCGYWNWLQWPDDFNVAATDLPESTYVFWIDEAQKTKTLQELKAGVQHEPQDLVFDKYKN